jgi:fatty-acyl-CoA synthase
LFRYTYAECAKRARKLANALKALNLKEGSVVGSIAWNNHRHMEAYYACIGQRHGDAHLQPTLASAATHLHHQPRRRRGGAVRQYLRALRSRALRRVAGQVRAWVCLSGCAPARPPSRAWPRSLRYDELALRLPAGRL